MSNGSSMFAPRQAEAFWKAIGDLWRCLTRSPERLLDAALSPHTEAGRIKPIDHFGLAVPNFSPETAAATVQRVLPGTKVERTGGAVFIYDPDGVRVQLVAR